METPGDRELRRRRGEANRGQIRHFRRIFTLQLCGSSILLLITSGFVWWTIVVCVATIALLGWTFLKDK
jgi:hypothetical protein